MGDRKATLRLLPLRSALPHSTQTNSDKLPARLKLLSWGVNETAKGPVVLNEVTAAVFAQNQRATGRERVAVDFQHNTVEGMPEYERSQEPRPVAGYGAPRLIPGDGLFLESITTTPEGVKHLGSYEDVSPTPWLAPDGTVVGLHSVALCREGSVYDLTLNGAALAAMSALLSVPNPSNHQDPPTHPMAEKVLTLTALAALLSLPAESTEQEIAARLKPFAAPPAPVAPDLGGITAQLSALSARLDNMATSVDATERRSLIDQATREGKVLPTDDTLKLLATPALKALIADIKPTLVAMTAGQARPIPASSGQNEAKAAARTQRAMQLFRENPSAGFKAAWDAAAE